MSIIKHDGRQRVRVANLFLNMERRLAPFWLHLYNLEFLPVFNASIIFEYFHKKILSKTLFCILLYFNKYFNSFIIIILVLIMCFMFPPCTYYQNWCPFFHAPHQQRIIQWSLTQIDKGRL